MAQHIHSPRTERNLDRTQMSFGDQYLVGYVLFPGHLACLTHPDDVANGTTYELEWVGSMLLTTRSKETTLADVFTEDLTLACPFKTREEALVNIKLIQERMQLPPLDVYQVKDYMRYTYRLYIANGYGYKTIHIVQQWVDRNHGLTQYEFTDRAEADQYLSTLKVELMNPLYEQIKKINRIQLK